MLSSTLLFVETIAGEMQTLYTTNLGTVICPRHKEKLGTGVLHNTTAECDGAHKYISINFCGVGST